ncbi:MAG: hypothetical protein AVDCRST_MAG07-323, partial [uncultured Frankineae bacterium]
EHRRPAVVARPSAARARQQRRPGLGGGGARRPGAAADRGAPRGGAVPRAPLAVRLPPGRGGAQLPHHRRAGDARLLAAGGRGRRDRRAPAGAAHRDGPGGTCRRGGPAGRLAPLPGQPAAAVL